MCPVLFQTMLREVSCLITLTFFSICYIGFCPAFQPAHQTWSILSWVSCIPVKAVPAHSILVNLFYLLHTQYALACGLLYEMAQHFKHYKAYTNMILLNYFGARDLLLLLKSKQAIDTAK